MITKLIGYTATTTNITFINRLHGFRITGTGSWVAQIDGSDNILTNVQDTGDGYFRFATPIPVQSIDITVTGTSDLTLIYS